MYRYTRNDGQKSNSIYVIILYCIVMGIENCADLAEFLATIWHDKIYRRN